MSLDRRGAGVAALLGLLVAASLAVRARRLGEGYWIDEGLSVGIASHPLREIPGLLGQDGSPPLYYALLHVWIEAAGTGEAATHALSLAFALLTVPAAYWAGSSLFGRGAGWGCAAVAAVNPFLTRYATETRMYSLVVLLSLLAAAAFVHAFVLGRRGYLPPVAVLLALLLYTHNWGLYVLGAAAAAVALLAARTRPRAPLLRDGALALGGAALLYLPWIPTLVDQARRTGAPWSASPGVADLLGGIAVPLGGPAAAGLLLLAAAAVVRAAAAARPALVTLVVLFAVPLAAGWLVATQVPGWSTRYLAVAAGPLVLLAGVGVARAPVLGVVALAAAVAPWSLPADPKPKSNVSALAAAVAPRLGPGDLVVSTQPEQVAVLAHYLPPGLSYATPLGPVADPGVMDWRDALPRLELARPERALAPLVMRLPPGARLLLVSPDADGPGNWRTSWTGAVVRRTAEWESALAADPRLRRVWVGAPGETTKLTRVRAVLFLRV